jgi:SAM-dependent methyltransferase
MEFFRNALPGSAQSILVVGCGSGEGALILARHARGARILAVDLSAENIRIARALFSHERIHYRKADVLSDALEGRWRFILLPDVYEHIPSARRAELHGRLRSLLAPGGRVLLTVPSLYHQRALQAAGTGLQIVDELVSLDDLNRLAVDLGATLSYFSTISVWRTNDYVHAIVELDAERYAPVTRDEWLPVKGCPRRCLSERVLGRLGRAVGLNRLRSRWRRARIQRRLSGSDIGRRL